MAAASRTNPFADNSEGDGGVIRDFGIYNDDDDDDDQNNSRRRGTISSARFNILSTMVGGGCLSLPLAFKQSGNALVGPVMLIVTGIITDFCFRLLVASANHLEKINNANSSSTSSDERRGRRHEPNREDPSYSPPPGKDTFESVTSEAFGQKAYVFSMALVVLMCFFGAVGYSVLLRDMMEPINDTLVHHLWNRHSHNGTSSNNNNSTTPTSTSWILNSDDYDKFEKDKGDVVAMFFEANDASDSHGQSWTSTKPSFFDVVPGFLNAFENDADEAGDGETKHIEQQQTWLQMNLTLFIVILLVTPFCTLRSLTALKNCGAASMTSVLILGSCIVFRSIQCNVKGSDGSGGQIQPWYTYLTYFPSSWRELLNAVPLYISCFVCHYNILPVHNELQNPTPKRVSWWLRSTTWFAVMLYMIMGFAGSSYAHCTPTGEISGNILLDFDKNDPLLFVGRMCLAVTITLAFPMLVIPARDIMIRSWITPMLSNRRQQQQQQQQRSNTSSGGGPSRLETLNEEGGESESGTVARTAIRSQQEELEEPLLQPQENPPEEETDDGALDDEQAAAGGEESVSNVPFSILLSTSIVIFWMAGAVASCVESIDIVWDLLGSSLSILLSYLIPAGTYLVITGRPVIGSDADNTNAARKWSRVLCWGLIIFFFPLMVVSTANAVVNTFF